MFICTVAWTICARKRFVRPLFIVSLYYQCNLATHLQLKELCWCCITYEICLTAVLFETGLVGATQGRRIAFDHVRTAHVQQRFEVHTWISSAQRLAAIDSVCKWAWRRTLWMSNILASPISLHCLSDGCWWVLLSSHLFRANYHLTGNSSLSLFICFSAANQFVWSAVPRVEIVDERGLSTPDKYYKAGSTIELKCVISKVPQPTSYVTWKHGVRMLNYDTSRGGIR